MLLPRRQLERVLLDVFKHINFKKSKPQTVSEYLLFIHETTFLAFVPLVKLMSKVFSVA